MTPEKERQLRQNVKDIRTNRDKMERTILQLLAHPDATADQIMKARESYLDLQQYIRRVNKQLREEKQLWVRRGYGVPEPIQI